MSVTDLDRKAQAAALLARGTSTDKTGEAVGVSGRTVRRWREDPSFENEVQTARRAILTETATALGAAARDAVAVLCAALGDESPTIRVRAALGILGALPTVSEHIELEQRLAALEVSITGGNAA